MNETYENLLRNLNIVKWELKERNDSSLNLCIKYITDVIVEAGKLNHKIVMLEAMAAQSVSDENIDWDGD